jgi:serine O-acetyltransferase
MNTNSLSLWELIREDLATHDGDWLRPGFIAIAGYRFGVWRMNVRWTVLRQFLSFLYRVLYRKSAYVHGIEIPYTASIGRRVKIEHQHGIVVHGDSVIGDDCILRQGVTLGIRDERYSQSAPRLGKRVSVGAGAKILGAVCIGNDAKIGANAVVLDDVPAGCTAVGIPARIVSRPIVHTETKFEEAAT